ncbi:MAG: glycoside hydrolase, partial [Deinococcus sp.]|nr:glycoside hydrolase [Deinococcus sp.]
MENLHAEILSLDGTWEATLHDGQVRTLEVPGVWETQGLGMLYAGPVRYRRTVFVPAQWAGKRVLLECDAVSYACTVRCNGQEVARHLGMWTRFAADLSPALRYGHDNVLELEVEKPTIDGRYPAATTLAGFLPFVVGTFGGIWQSLRLVAHQAPAFAQVQVHAAWLERGALTVQWSPQPAAPAGATVALVLRDLKGKILAQARAAESQGTIQLTVDQGRTWSPERPVLYTLRLGLELEGREVGAVERRIGFRSLRAVAGELQLNGQPCVLRGALQWGWYPERICPNPTPEQVRREIRALKALGCNLVKLCLVVPGPAYFQVADEEGMLLWLELPLWLPNVTAELRQRAPVEYAEIVEAVQHHPSVVVYSLGCELGSAVDAAFLQELDGVVRQRSSGALLCDNSGRAEAYGGVAVDLADFVDYHFYSDLHYFRPLLDHFRRDWQQERPWIFGEFCDFDTYVNRAELN